MKNSVSSIAAIVFFLFATALCAVAAEKKTVVMIAGKQSHGPGEHEHNAGVLLLAKCLSEGAADRVEVDLHAEY